MGIAFRRSLHGFGSTCKRSPGGGAPTTYQELAKALALTPPHRIHQVTEALEHLIAEDAATARPFIAAIAISKARGGLPAPGFFDCARRLGRFAGDAAGLEASRLPCAGVQRRGRVLGGNGNQ